ncbi:transposase [Carnimonas bestiolae]|uniref:transposase n=1 Tax=Carnimonas bestiolae TaxID=3402172 RepID=UPI003EDC729D
MKYDKEFKLKAVQQVLRQGGGIQSISGPLGLDPAKLRLWVKLYERHGIDGLIHKGASYTAEFKRQVIRRMRQEGWSHRQTAIEFNIRSHGHIGKWLSLYHDGGFDALNPKSRGRFSAMSRKRAQQPAKTGDQRSREELIEENEDLKAEIAYLKKLDELLRKEELNKGKRR